MMLQAQEDFHSQLSQSKETKDSLAAELEAKQAELNGKQAELNTAAQTASNLQSHFEEQGQQLTQRSEQANALQQRVREAADAQEELAKVCVLSFVILCIVAAN